MVVLADLFFMRRPLPRCGSHPAYSAPAMARATVACWARVSVFWPALWEYGLVSIHGVLPDLHGALDYRCLP